MKFILPLFLAGISLAAAQDSICVKYTKAVFGNDTADNELALISAVVNLAVLGDAELSVPGILAPEGGLAFFFSGGGPTTNRGDTPVTVNFLDGAADLPNPDPSSNTAILLSHLYQFFGALLGCSAAGFPAYTGDPDMLRVHKFMGISQQQNDFFIMQVGLSASALGVTDEDVMAIANVLDSTFNTRCPPLLMAEDGVPSFLVGTNPSICQAATCPLADGSPCDTNAPTVAPVVEEPQPDTNAPMAAPTLDTDLNELTSGAESGRAVAAGVAMAGFALLVTLA